MPSALLGPEARRGLLEAAGPLLSRLARTSKARPLRILLLRPDHLGDVLLTSPAVGLVRAAFADAQLTYLVGPWGAEVARRGPRVHVATLVFPGFTRRPARHLVAPYTLLVRTALHLRRQAFDAAAVFRPDHWWGALLALAAGIPVRVGFRLPETQPLLSHAFDLQPEQHAAERSLLLAHQLAGLYGRSAEASLEPVFRVAPDEHAAAARLLDQHGLSGERLVALQPSAGAPLKSWPERRWAELGERLGRAGYQIVLIGAPEDVDLLSAIRRRSSVPSLAGQSLGVSAALYARCGLVIGPDGGGLHLAAAVGTPTLRLYGPAPPAVYGPWPPAAGCQHVLLTRALACAPCGSLEGPPCGASALPACLLTIAVDDVVGAALAQLQRRT
ncbi:MAG TPA: glycosyltransferase family 9 protein [Chloroflexota bacterium]|nr:glycosyltransferase family 9 protein [Chloroflexota bacterium]